MTDVQAAYAAGFFDGEGSIQLLQVKGGASPIRLNFSQATRGVLEEIQSWFDGGKIYTDRRTEKYPNQRDNHSLRYAGAEAIRVLKELLSQLRVKHKEASLTLAYWSCPWRDRKDGPCGLRRNEWQRRIDAWFTRECKRLKNRGGKFSNWPQVDS